MSGVLAFPAALAALSAAPGSQTSAAPAPGADVSRQTPVVLAYRRARPAVVNISTEQVVTMGLSPFGRDIFEDIFPSPFTRRVPVQSLGSGFLVHQGGYAITNDHVVRRAQKITVTLADKTPLPARVISSDPTHDLAVLKVDPPKGVPLPYLPLGRSDDLMVGETVIAIGNPFGYSHTVSSGIISALDRKLEFKEGVAFEGLIQTDAPINPGSSGGPLLNIRGELIGINTAIRADAQNIGFAIPVDALIDDFGKLLDFERISRVIFGAVIRQRHAEAGDELYVAEVHPGTPASGALRVGDRLAAVNGVPVRQIPDFTCAMLGVKAPAAVQLRGLRDGSGFVASVALKPKPRPDGKALAQALFGVALRPITPEIARDLRLPVDAGLLVVGVDAGGPADRIGLRPRDIIFQVGRFYVQDLDALGMLLEDVPPGEAVKIGVARGSVAAWVTIQASRAAQPRPGPQTAPATQPPKPRPRPRPGTGDEV